MTLIAALCLTAMLGILGLGMDVGVLRMQQRELQTVADGAALGGAGEIQYGDVATGAANAAALNGFSSGSNGETLTVNNPPLSGPHSGNDQYVEVIATQPVATYFMKVFSVTSVTLTARAVAYLGNGPACLYTLDPSGSGAITLNGSFSVALQCSVYVNSSNSHALTANGSGSFSAKSIGIVGGDLTNGPVTVSPTPVTGMVPVTDPLAYLNPPSTSGSCATPTTINGSGTFTLNPGIYCSQLIINGSPQVTLNAGTYVLKAGMIVNGTPKLTGSGVTLYNNSGSITFNGNSSDNLSAPTSGAYAGILIFQSRSDNSQMTINGNNSSIFNGAVYAPDARIVDNGSGSAGAYTIFVADDLTVNGNAGLNDNYASLTSGSPIKAAVLVE